MNPSDALPHSPAEEQAALWAARLDGSALSAADREELAAWIAANPAHRELLTAFCQFSVDLEQQLPSLTGIRDQIAEARVPRSNALPTPWLRRPRLAGVALAAAAALAFAFWLGRPPTQEESIATPAARRQSVALADGSVMELNARTSVAVAIDSGRRHVQLADGQAFFTVTPGANRPFVVETPAGSVRVTGTRFDVRCDGASELAVTVAEGTVVVRPGVAADSPVKLSPGDRLVLAAGAVDVRHLTPAQLQNELAWREGQVVFEGEPLQAALGRFARYHGRAIRVAPGAADLRLGGRYSLDDLDGFFTALEEALPEVRVTRDQSGAVEVVRRPAR